MLRHLFFCRMAEKSGDNPGRSEGKVRRLKWDNDNMKAAMEAVSSWEMTVSASSRVFQVPRKTLDDRIRGNVSHGKKPGRTTILTPEEEESLTQYLLDMAERGFPLTRTMVKAPSPGPLQSVQVTMPGLVQSKVPVNIGSNYIENDIPILYSGSQTVSSVHVLKHLMK